MISVVSPDKKVSDRHVTSFVRMTARTQGLMQVKSMNLKMKKRLTFGQMVKVKR